jgi:hypothetical protein
MLEQEVEKYRAMEASVMAATNSSMKQQHTVFMHILLFFEPYVHDRFQ